MRKKLRNQLSLYSEKILLGIIAKVCTYLANNNVNILDINQTITGGFFNMMMIVESEEVVKTFLLWQASLSRLVRSLVLRFRHSTRKSLK